MYGLKQSPNAWFERFSDSLTKVGYRKSQVDHTLFVKQSLKGTTIVIVYVDDIVFTEDDPEEVNRLKSHLSSGFKVRDMVTYFTS